MGRVRISCLAAGIILWFSALGRASLPGADIWAVLHSAQPKNTGFPASGTVFVRDVFTFRLESGLFYPLAEVSGRIVGGVFKGHGRFELKPATESERRFLSLRSKQKDLQILSDSFEQAVFLFTDGAGKELLGTGPAVPGGGNEPASVYRRILKNVEKDFRVDLRLRLLPDLLEETPLSQGLFLACFEGAKLPPAIAVFAPGGLDGMWLGQTSGTETSALYVLDDQRGGCWYSERPLASREPARDPAAPRLNALHYSVETTIRKNTDIAGRTTMRFRSAAAGVRVVPLDLFAKLRVDSVRLKRGDGPAVDTAFIPADEKSTDPLIVILSVPLASGEEAELTTEYHGDEVLHDAGENNYYIGARQNWYPDLNGLRDWAVYDLTYRIPKNREIVSVGRLVESRTDGDFLVSRYTSGQPVRAAGFNYGVFKLIERADPDSGVRIRVYSNPGQTNFAQQLLALRPTIHFDTVSMAEDALADSLNTARVGTLYFGPLLQNDIAVTQQTDWSFGQSWPTLIYLPYMAFLDWVTRAELGLSDAKSFVEEVTPHEFAHQWWGHRVGSATYRDAWLEEGLAEFTVSLVIERAQGLNEFKNYWERARKFILETPRHSVCANFEAGPISLGTRLETGETPQAYSAIVYRKGAFVIHMLRSLFWDPKNADHDQRFRAMMKDFIETWAGRNPTTRDFQTIVERHAPAPFTGNMGWFFRQWVDGMSLPKIRSGIRVEDAANGRYRVTGDIVQSGVPDDFLSLIPLYFEFEKNRLVRFAQVTVTGNRTLPVRGEMALAKKPLRVVVNPYYELLTGR